ncbi:uncharacterized protein MONBRDRAFT_14100 [Monosiga brevicollis MX1]|uniref:Protein kinase domain-containing protein n=1 Tax=Monosiga brevicollis TaxID=81824 RepID=A9UQK2_MONBE|nr:uncharacterized protein MONBRDRAFT_14100 [Monosiga brevicollis MX1]EDQ93060.1 predicted protein [Monosiga brevicollis MX1]|eukprot:XP_001742822.1 hypothetical protein [Monosiga brevicollis MX1]
MAGSCRSITEFEKLNILGEGTYGVVYRARDSRTGHQVAVKQVKMNQERGGLPLSSLREITALQQLRHTNVLQLLHVAAGRRLTSIFLIMEYCEHDLAALVDNMPAPFPEPAVKCLMQQLFAGLDAMHRECLIHRDLKLSNLLLTDHGILKVADFGLTRVIEDPAHHMSPTVVTLWYRPPELVFGMKNYTRAVDIWSCGCIFAELLAHEPLFPAKTEVALLEMVIGLLGAPHESIWPAFRDLPLAHRFHMPHQPYSNLKQRFGFLSSTGLDLMQDLLMYDPEKRLSAIAASVHPYFRTAPLPLDPEFMPTFPRHRNYNH